MDEARLLGPLFDGHVMDKCETQSRERERERGIEETTQPVNSGQLLSTVEMASGVLLLFVDHVFNPTAQWPVATAVMAA